MALHEQNRMLQILHKNGVNRKHIGTIMNDLKGSGIFDEDEFEADIDWETINQESFIEFSNLSSKEKQEAIEDIRQQREEERWEKESSKLRYQFLYEAEQRVLAKMKEMEEKGLTGPDEVVETVEEENLDLVITRYGRSPLHEAIAMRDIRLVKKYVKKGLYLTSVDNNGHTPAAMAYYEGYKEAIIVFDAYQSKK